MTPAFFASASPTETTGTTDTVSAPASVQSPLQHVRHDLLIGLGALLVLVGIIAFSVFGEPHGVASATPAQSSASTSAGFTATPVALVRPEAAPVAAAPAVVTPPDLSAAVAYIEAVSAQARADAEAAAAEAAAQRQAARAASRSNTGAAAPAVAGGSVWDSLAQCESGGNWGINTGNGFSGGVQFVRSTWLGMGGGEFAPDAYLASREQQIVVAERVLASQGWGAWPGCSSKLGLR